jgi:hypothetical protein
MTKFPMNFHCRTNNGKCFRVSLVVVRRFHRFAQIKI